MAYFLPTHSRTKFIIRIFIRQYTKRSFFKLSENGCTAPFHGEALIAIELRMALQISGSILEPFGAENMKTMRLR